MYLRNMEWLTWNKVLDITAIMSVEFCLVQCLLIDDGKKACDSSNTNHLRISQMAVLLSLTMPLGQRKRAIFKTKPIICLLTSSGLITDTSPNTV